MWFDFILLFNFFLNAQQIHLDQFFYNPFLVYILVVFTDNFNTKLCMNRDYIYLYNWIVYLIRIEFYNNNSITYFYTVVICKQVCDDVFLVTSYRKHLVLYFEDYCKCYSDLSVRIYFDVR